MEYRRASSNRTTAYEVNSIVPLEFDRPLAMLNEGVSHFTNSEIPADPQATSPPHLEVDLFSLQGIFDRLT